MQQRVVVSVINDLVSDQRVHRTCLTLHDLGYDVTLVGRKLKNSLPVEPRAYKTKRMSLIFTRGAFFYAEFNLRLFFKLLFTRYDILHANDLDTLLPNYVAKKIKGGDLVYDSHEYFTEVPEIQGRWVKKVWLKIEQFIFPKLKTVITVNPSIANIYKTKYGVDVKVVRNVPFANKFNSSSFNDVGLKIPENKKVLLLQGAGINVDRGAEEIVEAMQYIDAVLLIVGSGDVLPTIKAMVRDLDLSQKVIITGKVPFEQLIGYTRLADFGLTLDKDSNLNYKYSLPNKLFDYIQANLPVIASNLIEVKKIIEQYNCGIILKNWKPKDVAHQINDLLNNENLINELKAGVVEAKEALVWENEKLTLINCYKSFE